MNQGGYFFLRVDGDSLTVSGNLVDFQIMGSPVVPPDEVFQTGFNGVTGYLFPVGKGDVITQLDF